MIIHTPKTHDDCGYGYKVVCSHDDKYSKPVQIYRGENAVYKFMDKMLFEVKYCKNIVKNKFNRPLKMTDNDELRFKQTNKCHICNKKYSDQDVRVQVYWKVQGLSSSKMQFETKYHTRSYHKQSQVHGSRRKNCRHNRSN